jgi:presenilin-like A22 family membrane protease
LRTVAYLALFSFAASLALALAVGWAFTLAGVSVIEEPERAENALYFFGYIIAAAVAVLLLLKYYKGRRLFHLLELLIDFSAVQLLASLFMPEIAAIVAGGLAVFVRLFFPPARNLLLLLTTAVIGALLGSSLGVVPAALLGILLSGYDYYAVFISKHMVKMAQQLEQRQAAFAVEVRHEKESLHLGTGDLVIPATLAVSALKLGPGSYGAGAALSTAFGCLVGLAVLIYHLERRRGYWPALPPLVGFGLAGLLAYALLPV